MHPVRRIFVLLTLAAMALPASSIPVILDTDIGDDIDDALALALALQSPELDVRAVVTVLQHRERRADLAWKILELYGRTDIPVGMGAEQPLLTPPRTGEVRQTAALGESYRMPENRRRNGIQLTIDTCLNSREKITILAYGPLTNLALALKSEPRIAEKIERFVLMNGIFFGGVRAEYNTVRDPEAAEIVFRSGIPIVTVGLDVTMKCRMAPDDMKRFETSGLPSAKFLLEIIRIWQGGRAVQMPVLHDPLAVAVTFRPSLIRTLNGRVTVETKGQPQVTYGATAFREDPKGTTQVASEVDSRGFIDLFLDRVLSEPRKK